MNTTDVTMVVETSSEPAIELTARVSRPSRKSSAAKRIAAMNAQMDANPERIARAFEANTRRLTGKPSV